MHECQEIRSANINQKEGRFLIYERDLMLQLIYNCVLYFAFLIKIAGGVSKSMLTLNEAIIDVKEG